MSPEKCIVVVIGIIPLVWEKADGLDAPEGSSPVCAKASRQDTTGVLGSGRQGLNLAGESPVIPIARFGYVAIPRFV